MITEEEDEDGPTCGCSDEDGPCDRHNGCSGEGGSERVAREREEMIETWRMKR